MAYVAEDDVIPDLPAQFLQQALQDGADAVTFELVATRASEAVDALLAARYVVPLDEASDAITVAKEAARIFALETLYKRRGYFGDVNPWTELAKDWRKRLSDIAAKKTELTPGHANKKAGVKVIKETARSNSEGLSA